MTELQLKRYTSLMEKGQKCQAKYNDLYKKLEVEKSARKREQLRLEMEIEHLQLSVYAGKIKLLTEFGK